MNLRRPIVGFGAAITTFVFVAVLVIETVRVDPGAGILGVLLGTGSAIVTFTIIALKFDAVDPPLRWGIEAGAGFGYSVLVLLGLSYANVAGLRSAITPTSIVTIATITAVAVLLRSWSRRHRTEQS